jgi:GNAT superfamily N-acetyltransferase
MTAVLTDNRVVTRHLVPEEPIENARGRGDPLGERVDPRTGRGDALTGRGDALARRGDPLEVRTIRPGDETLVEEMSADLSARSLYRRFFAGTPRVPRAVLRQLATVDHCRSEVVLALHGGRLVGWAQYVTPPGSADADFAVIVADRWHRRGVSKRLADRLVDLARARGITHFTASVLADNNPAIRALAARWPHAHAAYDGNLITFRMALA